MCIKTALVFLRSRLVWPNQWQNSSELAAVLCLLSQVDQILRRSFSAFGVIADALEGGPVWLPLSQEPSVDVQPTTHTK